MPIISTKYLAQEWIQLYRQRPVLTALTTLVAIATMIGGVIELNAYDKKRKDAVRLKNVTYSEQIQELDDIEKSVSQLLTFLDTQKQSMEKSQDALADLKKQRETLAPLVTSDQKVIDSMFLAQERRSESKVWTERWIGFGFGIVASLIASFLWFVGDYYLKVRHNKNG